MSIGAFKTNIYYIFSSGSDKALKILANFKIFKNTDSSDL